MGRSHAGRALLLATTAIAAFAALGGGSAQAQTAGEATANIQEIIVTAQRRSERLQDVPMSITALSAEALERSGIANTADLARVTPGLTMGFFGNNLQPAIRGVTATGGTIGDTSAVPIYLDGVYQPHQLATLMELPDVKQIEVLKGPQGALYGQNATGGAIIVTTASPSFTPTGQLRASYGNYDDVNLRGFVSGPVTDSLAVSLAAARQERDGFRRHVLTGERNRGLKSELVRGKILFRPSDAVRLTLTSYYAERTDSARQAVSALHNSSSAYLSIPTAPRVTSPSQFGGTPRAFQTNKSLGYSAKGEFDLGAGTLNLMAAYSRNKVSSYADVDATPIDLAENESLRRLGKYTVAEGNFVSRKFGQLSFLAGAFYLKGSDAFLPSRFLQFRPSLPPAPLSAPVFVSANLSEKKDEILAGYAEVTYDVTDQLVLTAGGRYTHHTQRAWRVASVTPPMLPYPGNPAKWSKFSPRLAVRYELTPNQNVYATFAQGFKGGQINPGSFTQAPTDPEVITSYEVGYKGRIADNVRLNVSAFWYEYKDLQVVAYLAPLYVTQNAASARGKGVEIEGDWAVTPELTLSGGVAYLDAKYRKFPLAQSFVPNGFGNTTVTADLTGQRLLRSPKWSGNLSANYQVDLAAGRFGAFVSVYYSDNIFVDPYGLVKQGAFQTVDGELSFAPNDVRGLRLVLWGKNLTNKDYLASASVSTFSSSVTYNDPRTYGVRAEYAF